jgi:hypothetical protein
VELLQPLVDRPGAHHTFGNHPLAKRLDVRGRDRRQRRVLAELRDQSLLDLAAVVADRRWPPLPVDLDVPHPLLARLAEGDLVGGARLDPDGGVAAGKDLCELELRLASRDESLRRPAPFHPCRPEAPLKPPAADGADLRVEDRPAGALNDPDEPGRRTPLDPRHEPTVAPNLNGSSVLAFSPAQLAQLPESDLRFCTLLASRSVSSRSTLSP